MTELHLFDGISPESVQAMMACFKPEKRFFRKGETVLVYAQELENLCVLLRGSAHLYCMDSEGDYALLERYGPDDIFGEVFAVPYGDLGYAVQADSDCTVLFIRFSCVCGRCPNACAHHSRLTANLFELAARKAQALSLRINLLSKRSLRRKLCAYFAALQSRSGSDSFEIEGSLSQLANYLCADRTSLMRELKAMADGGLIRRQGRRVTVLDLNKG